MVYPTLLPLIRTTRLPVVDWTDAPADLNGLVRFAERPNLVSARLPSHFKRSVPTFLIHSLLNSNLKIWRKWTKTLYLTIFLFQKRNYPSTARDTVHLTGVVLSFRAERENKQRRERKASFNDADCCYFYYSGCNRRMNMEHWWGWYWQGKAEVLVHKTVPVLFCRLKIPRGLALDWTWSPAARSRRLTDWAAGSCSQEFGQQQGNFK
jgi:hypothetical protein